MLDTISRKAGYYFSFYVDYVSDMWDDITYWQYIGVMVFGLFLGYMLLMRQKLHGFK